MLKYKESILYIVLILGIFIFTLSKAFPDLNNIFSNLQSINSLSNQSKELEMRVQELEKQKIERASISDVSKEVYKPESQGTEIESSFTGMFDDIIDMAKYNGMKIYAIQYNYNPADDEFVKNASDKFNVCEIDAQLVSDYTDLQGFLRDLYKYRYLVNIDKLQIAPYPKNKRILLTTLCLKIYSAK